MSFSSIIYWQWDDRHLTVNNEGRLTCGNQGDTDFNGQPMAAVVCLRRENDRWTVWSNDPVNIEEE